MYKLDLLTSFNRLYFLLYDYQAKGILDEQRKLSLAESYNKANIFLGLMEYELNSLRGAKCFAPRRLYISSYSIRP